MDDVYEFVDRWVGVRIGLYLSVGDGEIEKTRLDAL